MTASATATIAKASWPRNKNTTPTSTAATIRIIASGEAAPRVSSSPGSTCGFPQRIPPAAGLQTAGWVGSLWMEPYRL